MKRFFAFASACIAATAMCFAVPAVAQDKIDRPVKILVGFPAGGTADVMARVVADKMKDTLGQPAIVYLHPWEFDPGQPRLRAGFVDRTKHYLNLGKTEGKFRRILGEFSFDSVRNVLRRLSLLS